MLSQSGLSAWNDRVGSRYRALGLDLAGPCRMGCSNVSSSERQRGQRVSGSSDHQEGWGGQVALVGAHLVNASRDELV